MKKLIALVCMLGLVLQLSVPAFAAGTGDIAYGTGVTFEADSLPEPTEEDPDETEPPQEPDESELPQDPPEAEQPPQPEEPAAQAEAAGELETAAEPTTVITYLELVAALQAGGTVLLGANITLSEGQTLSLADNTEVTLRSAVGSQYIKRSETLTAGELIVIPATASLTLEDIVLDGGNTTTTPLESLRPLLSNAGTLTVGDGAVLRNNNNIVTEGNPGGAVNNAAGATLVLDGGRIEGNRGCNGGGVKNLGSFTMLDGEISGNTAQNGGGVANLGSFTMLDGEISGNTATGSGGGLHIGGASQVEIAGGSISDNTAATSGGGVYCSMSSGSGRSFSMAGGEVSGNTAPSGGGAYVAGSGAVTFGGIVDGNTAQKGGGLYVHQHSNFTLSSTMVVENYAALGSELYANATTLKLNGMLGMLVVGTSSSGVYFEGSAGMNVAAGTLDNGASIYFEGTTADSNNILGGFLYKSYFKLVRGSGATLEEDDPHLRLKRATAAASLQDRIDDALEAANGKPVTIPINGIEELTQQLVIPAGADVTLTDGKLVRGDALTTTMSMIIIKAKAGNKPAGKLTLSHVTVDGLGEPVDANGALVDVDGGARLSLLSGTVLRGGNTSSYGGAIYMDSSASEEHGEITIDGATITGNSSGGDGGGIYNGRGTVTMKSGAITGNTASIDGGAISCPFGTFTMTGGTIAGNTAGRDGGGVCLKSDAQFEMAGGAITGNSARYGGGIYSAGSTASVEMTGGVISGNTASFDGGEIRISNGVFTLAPKAVITIGQAGGSSGVSLASGILFISLKGSLKTGSRVILERVASTEGQLVVKSTVKLSAAQQKMFTLLMEGHILKPSADGKQLHLSLSSTETEENKTLQQRIDDATPGQVITLDGEVRQTTPLTIGDGVNVVLTGGTLVRAFSTSGILITIKQGGSLTLKNITVDGDANTHSYIVMNNGTLKLQAGATLQNNKTSAVRNVSVATLEMSGGSITGINDPTYASVYNDGRFEMSGGSITGNSGRQGAGVYNTGRFEMSGGSITGNTAYFGAGVYNTGGTFLLSGGTISGNKATSTSSGEGGGVYNTGRFEMSGGSITGNTSSGIGGGVSVNTAASEFTMHGGAITGNTAGTEGGGVRVNFGAFTLNSGIISGNTSTGSGGGVYCQNSDTLAIKGGTISNNNADSSGGGIFAQNVSNVILAGSTITGNTGLYGGGVHHSGSNSALTIDGAAITGNTAGRDGGGVIKGGSGSLTFISGSISGNTTGEDGGGVYCNSAQFIMNGGAINDNTAMSGGGVYSVGTVGAFTLNAGTISGNVAASNSYSVQGGGGVFVRNSRFAMRGGAITGNTAITPQGGSYGGGGLHIYESKSAAVISGGAITGNTANNYGGGIYSTGITTSVEMTGGVISGNSAAQGGGLFGQGSAFTLTNGTISGNTSETGGGLRFVDGTAVLTGGSVSGNSANNNGGGVYGYGVTLTLSGSAIRANHAKNGGGLYLSDSSTTLNGGAITGNTAAGNGGGIYNISGTLTIGGGAISGNTAETTGGGVYYYSGSITMAGGTISGNTGAQNTGGDLFIAVSANAFTYSGGVVGSPGTAHGIYYMDGAGAQPVRLAKDLAPGDLLLFENNLSGGGVATATDVYAGTNPAGNSGYLGMTDGRGITYADGMYKVASRPAKLLYLSGGLGGFTLKIPDPTGDKLPDTSTMMPPVPGYTFAGWNTKADGSGNNIPAGEPLPFPTADENGLSVLTLHAVWLPQVNRLTFYTDDPGIPYEPGASGNAATYTPGENTRLAAPLYSGQNGKAFAGWYLKGDAGKALLTNISPFWRGDIELVARWGTEAVAEPDDFTTTPTDLPQMTPGSTNRKLTTWLNQTDTADHNAVGLYSSNPTVATVAPDGDITAHQAGTAVITVCRSYKPSITFSLPVEVNPLAGKALAFVEGPAVVGQTVLQLVNGGGAWQDGTPKADFGQHLAEYDTGTSMYQPVASPTDFTWDSSNKRVATVDASGVVTPVKAGTADITATRGNETASISVQVVGRDAAIKTMKLNKSSLALVVGKTATLSASYSPKKPTLAATQWMVLDGGAGNIVTVDQKGKVTATGPGKVTVRLAATDVLGTRYEAECTVTVTQPPTGVKVSVSGTINSAGELVLVRSAGEPYPSAEPSAAVQPGNATNKGVTYSPQTPSAKKLAGTVAYYDTASKKIVAGGKDGVATITAKTTAGGKKSTLKVRVVTPATGIQLLKKDKTTPASDFSANTGATTQLYAKLEGLATTPARRSSDTITWKSSDATVATVDKTGKVKAVGYGTATISVEPTGNYDGVPAKSVKVTVDTPVKSFKIDQKSFSLLGGGRAQLTASANNGQAKTGAVTWSSANTNSLKVSSGGLVVTSAVTKKTTVKVTAKQTDTGKSSTISITLLPGSYTAVSKVGLKKAAPALLATGKSFTPSLIYTPSKPTNKMMRWTATASGVAEDGTQLKKIDLDGAAWLDAATGKLTGRLSAAYKEATVTVTGTALGGNGAKLSYSLRVVHPTAKVTLYDSDKAGAAPVTQLALEESGGAILYADTDTVSPVTFTWKSSNTKVVQVSPSSDGTSAALVGLKGGSATITATVNDGTNKKATIKVTVTQQVRNVVLGGMNPPADENKSKPSLTDGNAVVTGGYYGTTEVKENKTGTLKATLNAGLGAPKNKKVGYQVLAEYNANRIPVAPGSIVSLDAKTGKVKGLVKGGYALIRVYSEECPVNDFAATIPAKGKVKAEFARNICVVKVT